MFTCIVSVYRCIGANVCMFVPISGSNLEVKEIDVLGNFWQLTGGEDGYAQICSVCVYMLMSRLSAPLRI